MVIFLRKDQFFSLFLAKKSIFRKRKLEKHLEHRSETSRLHDMQASPLQTKTYAFALQVLFFCRELNAMREYVLAKQLLKSGTSIGANVEEATRAQSRADFIAKLSISFKEASETDFWLRLLIDANILQEKAIPLRKQLDEILRLLSASIYTAQHPKK